MPELTEITDAEIRGDVTAILARLQPRPFDPLVTAAIDDLTAHIRALLDRPRPGYTYRAVVARWVDGDSVHLDIDLGLRKWAHDEPIRLLGVNAPDRKPAKGIATAWMRDTCPVGSEIVVRTELDEEDRYGRLLGDLWLGDVHLNTALIDAGHAMPYDGGKRPDDY